MSVHEYGLKFTQLPWYAPYMVIDSRAQMNKFLFGVSHLNNTACRNIMLLGDMDISWLMTNAQQVEGDKLREMVEDNKNARKWIYDFLYKERVVEIAHSLSRGLQPQHPHQLALLP
ncbi:hypothetical protein MTR67_018236 [Solanum verrucosum]|uniref:Uncharacterized protein n=1 Tax=Solanum verrucosum TaxID=315347 RepID=A0AAF0QQD8_SOLVR|nr:hypothetical protein MTR67_018236 [Solanum verrucosum]